jgi:hypothetical protein
MAPASHRASLKRWLGGDQPKTLGNIIELFGERSFALIFVLVMALPALPLPTGGAAHVLEVVTMLVALELVLGRRCIWLPARKRLALGTPARQKVLIALLRRIRWLERVLASARRLAVRAPRHEERVRSRGVRATLSAFLAPPLLRARHPCPRLASS